MGVWGTGIFQDDLACDIRERYRDLLGEDLEDPSAKARIMKDYQDSVTDPEECGVVWLALAATQWKLGRLDDDTLRHALQVIESGSDLARWEPGSKDYARRRTALEALQGQLTSSQPPKRKIARRVLCECPWKVGDLFAYRLLSGALLLFRVIDHHTDQGGTYPVCEILDWVGKEIPSRNVLKVTATRRSRADYKSTIYKVMLVGLNRKWLKRIQNLNLNLTPFHKRIWKFIPGTTIRSEHEPTSVVHFKILDSFLKEWFLVE
jgi:hypothetical protein